mmetsp:Transcript_90030/g.226508  ORF Transcript_90030/g.226508 Transcript_90030/m.226508 type:complete len:84 (-) Transcript_90030:54-305(-)
MVAAANMEKLSEKQSRKKFLSEKALSLRIWVFGAPKLFNSQPLLCTNQYTEGAHKDQRKMLVSMANIAALGGVLRLLGGLLGC